MLAAGIALLAISSVGIWTAIVQEKRTHEPIYKLLMKVFPWVFGVGAVVFAVAMAGG